MRKWWVWCQPGRCLDTRTLRTCPCSKLCLKRPCGRFQGLCWGDSEIGVVSRGCQAGARARVRLKEGPEAPERQTCIVFSLQPLPCSPYELSGHYGKGN